MIKLLYNLVQIFGTYIDFNHLQKKCEIKDQMKLATEEPNILGELGNEIDTVVFNNYIR